MTVRILQGDCRDVLKTLEADSVDSCVTDPPYHLTNSGGGPAKGQNNAYSRSKAGAGSGGFMGMKWDGGDVAFRDRHFRRSPGVDELWELSAAVRAAVAFRRDNLLAPVWIGTEGPYDLIFADAFEA